MTVMQVMSSHWQVNYGMEVYQFRILPVNQVTSIFFEMSALIHLAEA